MKTTNSHRLSMCCALLQVLFGLALAASELSVTTVLRSYSGTAVSSNVTTTREEPLNVTETGLGSLPSAEAVASLEATTRAIGDAAIAEVSSSTNDGYQLHVATASRATFRSSLIYYIPSYAHATASVHLSAQLDLSAETAPTDIVFTASLEQTGDTNSGVIHIPSSSDGALGRWDFGNLPGKWIVTASAGSVITLNIDTASSSRRGAGDFAFQTYTDADTQDLRLRLGIYPQRDFSILEFSEDAANGYVLSWTAHPDFTYQVQCSGTLNQDDWRDVGPPLSGSGGEPMLSYRDNFGDVLSPRFYRIVRSLLR
ncbi:MAG: hypothetical protein KJ072_00270 [Verrucomicrobia bacterium]|nr:hypothetical protein [Verrucomicrobiota bacterium]